ncbi:MAG TPA: ABC transporter permease [Pirellulales bacterium]|jgi:putative ABC transport system permease protein|nr:ABC transporter permease [Pirellulales bacterium]
MIWIAWKMLTGNPGKYVGIILGISFAALLIAQQSSIFCGLMRLTTSQIQDITGADIWVMDPNVQYVDDIKPMSDNDLYRVRGVSGVEWAVRLYKGITRARLPDGNFQQVIMIGLDDASLVGAPQIMLAGSLEDLRQPDSIIMDEAGYRLLWPGQPLLPGKSFEMNDRRAIVVGVCKSRRTFMTFPIVYTRYSQATLFIPAERKVLSFVLTSPVPGISSEEVCERIDNQTGLKALTRDQFMETTIIYYLKKTGIPMNFGITVLLGFIVGTAISGQTFYLFTIENLKQFGALKAMGATNMRLVGMILLQAVVVGVVGYGLGVGAAAIFGATIGNTDRLAFYMPWGVLVGTGVAVMFMVVLASLLSVRRVLVLPPAIVFQG